MQAVRIIGSFLLLLLTAGQEIRLNCGYVTPFKDDSGIEWQPDQYSLSGTAWRSIFTLFLGSEGHLASYRLGFFSNVRYKIPVAPGNYDLKLYFYPNSFFASFLQFDVYIQSERKVSYDQEKSITFPAIAVEDTLDIRLVPRFFSLALVAAIEVAPTAVEDPVETLTPTTTPTEAPTRSPTAVPTNVPTRGPTTLPTEGPTIQPTKEPTKAPAASASGRTDSPVAASTKSPTSAPTVSPTESPSAEPNVAPTTRPTTTPTEFPTVSPTKSPTGAPIKTPTTSPTASPTTKPTETPTAAPTAAPTVTPTTSPTDPPTSSRTSSPTTAPTEAPVAPTSSPTDTPQTDPPPDFEPIYINCGAEEYTDSQGRLWKNDSEFAQGGKTYKRDVDILGTEDDFIYQTERYGEFSYAIPIDIGTFEVVFHMAEIYVNGPGQREFDIQAEGVTLYERADLMKLSSNERFRAIQLKKVVTVDDGTLNIDFLETVPKLNNPKVNGIEVKIVKPHLAHAVPQGPYHAVAPSGGGNVEIEVDGSPSHTHGADLELTSLEWKLGTTTIGSGEKPTLSLPEGEHVVTLYVEDSGGNKDAASTTVVIYPFGYPTIESISPDSASFEGGAVVTIRGTGYTYSADETKVWFGLTSVEGPDSIQVISEVSLRVTVPSYSIGSDVDVKVETPLGTSASINFQYIAGVPIKFKQGKLFDQSMPTCITFGPDGRLYFGTAKGKVVRLTLDDTFTEVVSAVQSNVLNGNRTILGIALDPMDSSSNPTVYIGHSNTFHGDPNSSSGAAINGKISAIKGANLDVLEDVVTGLPVSDHDHGVNGLEFTDNGDLLIAIGGNTNAGVPGALSGTRLQKENPLSAAILVAHLSDPEFSGLIEYDADDDGNVVEGSGVEVFSSGHRNPYDIVLHSNGNLFSTDNGANLNYGPMSTGCSEGEQVADVQEADKINLVVKGGYYGHPNRKRGAGDSRQCVWRKATDPSGSGYTAPIAIAPASADGIIEYAADHFNKQLRGNLIYSKYKDGLHRVILDSSGTSVVPESKPPIPLVGDNGLDVTQAPNGVMIDVRFLSGSLFYYEPDEPFTSNMIVKSVFPRRGGKAGGTSLNLYGVNFLTTDLSVHVGGRECTVTSSSITKIVCTLPGGDGTVDVTVSVGSVRSYTFSRGYRYISGLPDR